MIYKDRPYLVSPYTFRSGRSELNDVGRDVLSFIKTHPADSRFDSLLEQLAAEYDVDRSMLEEDVCAFLDECVGKDILINKNQDDECETVLREIHAIQEEIPELTISKFGHVVRLGKEFTGGCQSCARGKWAVFFVGPQCNQNCWYCPYTDLPERQRMPQSPGEDGADSISFAGIRFRSFRDLQLQFSLIHEKFDAFAWLGGEPMMPGVLERVLPKIQYFHQAYPTYHQWMYTNGTFATNDNMRRLYDAGIRELRFNLSATQFDRKVIAHMKEARRVFDQVCLEIPMTRKNYENLLDNADEILDTGLDQMNLAEFIVGEHHLAQAQKLQSEGRLYSYKGFICSPVKSRRYTYEVIRRAVKEKWPVVINDCSNEYKFYKLSIQEAKNVNIFQGRTDYWRNTYRLTEIDAFNDALPTPTRT